MWGLAMNSFNILYTNISIKCYRLLSDNRGQTLVEYALLIVLIALVAIASMKIIGCNVTDVFSTTATSLR